MRNTPLFISILFCFILVGISCVQQSDPWTEKDLMPPAELAKVLSDPAAKKPHIFSVGPSASIPGSIDVGPGKDKENIEKLKVELKKLSKDDAIVFYCGCCPFKNCPNVRPPFQLLKDMKFTNFKLLNLAQNFKTDWIDKGYPINE